MTMTVAPIPAHPDKEVSSHPHLQLFPMTTAPPAQAMWWWPFPASASSSAALKVPKIWIPCAKLGCDSSWSKTSKKSLRCSWWFPKHTYPDHLSFTVGEDNCINNTHKSAARYTSQQEIWLCKLWCSQHISWSFCCSPVLHKSSNTPLETPAKHKLIIVILLDKGLCSGIHLVGKLYKWQWGWCDTTACSSKGALPRDHAVNNVVTPCDIKEPQFNPQQERKEADVGGGALHKVFLDGDKQLIYGLSGALETMILTVQVVVHTWLRVDLVTMTCINNAGCTSTSMVFGCILAVIGGLTCLWCYWMLG